MRYFNTTDIFATPFQPRDYLCSEQDGSGMDNGGNDSTDSAGGGFVDNGSFDISSDPSSFGADPAMGFAQDAAVATATTIAAGAAATAGVAGVIGFGAAMAIDVLSGGPMSTAVGDAAQQGFGQLANDPQGMGFGIQATETSGFNDTSQNGSGFGGGGSSDQSFVPLADWHGG